MKQDCFKLEIYSITNQLFILGIPYSYYLLYNKKEGQCRYYL